MGELVVLGKFGAPHGVKGFVHLYSYTEPSLQLFMYPELLMSDHHGQKSRIKVTEHKAHGNHFLVKLAGVEDRDAAAKLTNRDLLVARDALPPLEEGEYYWADLEGLRVVNAEGKYLGKMTGMFETGANAVMVVKDEQSREFYVPYLKEKVVLSVDLDKAVITVDWDNA